MMKTSRPDRFRDKKNVCNCSADYLFLFILCVFVHLFAVCVFVCCFSFGVSLTNVDVRRKVRAFQIILNQESSNNNKNQMRKMALKSEQWQNKRTKSCVRQRKQHSSNNNNHAQPKKCGKMKRIVPLLLDMTYKDNKLWLRSD